MQHTVQITFDADGNPVAVSSDGKHIEVNCKVKLKDQIRWISCHGTVDVEFQNGTPLAGGSKGGDAKFQTIAADKGIFQYTCTITTKDGKKHGWPGKSNGGGTVEVEGGRSDN